MAKTGPQSRMHFERWRDLEYSKPWLVCEHHYRHTPSINILLHNGDCEGS